MRQSCPKIQFGRTKYCGFFRVKIQNWTPKMFSNKTNFWTQKVILEQCVASPKPKVLFKKYVNDRGNRGKKSHMSYALKNVREKCIWSISQNTLRFIYMVIIASFLCGACLRHNWCTTLQHIFFCFFCVGFHFFFASKAGAAGAFILLPTDLFAKKRTPKKAAKTNAPKITPIDLGWKKIPKLS